MNRYLLTIIFFTLLFIARAQDPQYSQFYANALYLSPAFAGAEENSRGIFAARYQWPGLDASYISSTVSLDHYIDRYKSGVGFIGTYDFSTAAKIKSSEAGLIYAYQIDVAKNAVFRPALQVSYVSRSIDFSRLTFGSQYSNNGFHGGPNYEPSTGNTISYADVSAGGLFYCKNYWVGMAANHLNTPDQSFINGESRLPVKAALFGGYKFSFVPEWKKKHISSKLEKSITPTIQYKMQGKSDQLDIGVYGQYNEFIIGAWYRGIPLKLYKPERTNNDALVFLIGFVYEGFKMGYSYDYTISKLSGISGGSHEITFSYRFKVRKAKRIQKRPQCPEF